MAGFKSGSGVLSKNLMAVSQGSCDTKAVFVLTKLDVRAISVEIGVMVISPNGSKAEKLKAVLQCKSHKMVYNPSFLDFLMSRTSNLKVKSEQRLQQE